MRLSLYLLLIVFLKFSFSNKDPDTHRSFEEIILTNGYHLETHIVPTKDFYNLKVYKITSPKIKSLKPFPILFMHGLADSSDSWIANDKEKNFIFLLADRGFEVWAGNNRGNKHSRSNTKISPKDKKFWNFSMHEMGLYDSPSIIDHIHDKSYTEKRNPIYIGHSQGGAQALILCSLNSDYCASKVKGIIGLAPASLVDSMRSPLATELIKTHSLELLQRLGYEELFSSRENYNHLVKLLCNYFSVFCNISLEKFSDEDINEVNRHRLEVFEAHFPSGLSLKSVMHFEKLYKTKKFINYDTDLEYPLKEISIPIYLHCGKGDLLVDPIDVLRLYNLINEKWRKKIYIYNKIGHLGMLLSNNQENYIDKVISDIEELANSN